MSSAVRPVRVGLDGAFIGDGALGALIDERVYTDSSKPEGASLPFLLFGTVSEGDFRVFQRDGNDGVRYVHIHADDEDAVETIYGHIKRICAAGVAVTGHTVLRMGATLVDTKADPSGSAHGVVRIAALTQAA